MQNGANHRLKEGFYKTFTHGASPGGSQGQCTKGGEKQRTSHRPNNAQGARTLGGPRTPGLLAPPGRRAAVPVPAGPRGPRGRPSRAACPRPTGLSQPSAGRERGSRRPRGAKGAGRRPVRGRPRSALTLQQAGDETVHVQLPVRHLVGSRRSFPAAGARASRRRRLRRRLGVPSPTSHAACRPRRQLPASPGPSPHPLPAEPRSART